MWTYIIFSDVFPSELRVPPVFSLTCGGASEQLLDPCSHLKSLGILILNICENNLNVQILETMLNNVKGC